MIETAAYTAGAIFVAIVLAATIYVTIQILLDAAASRYNDLLAAIDRAAARRAAKR